MIRSAFPLLLFALAFLAPAFGVAQSEVPQEVMAEEQSASVEVSDVPAMPKDTLASSSSDAPVFDPEVYQSLVFTHWEYVAIDDARKSRGMVRPPSEAELTRDLKTREDEKVKPPPEERYVTLSGIVYKAPKDWTIWLNEQRITPDALPKEALDLKVFKTYIEVKWFDEYTNQIFPIRLRPHQRFHIDTRIFLPG